LTPIEANPSPGKRSSIEAYLVLGFLAVFLIICYFVKWPEGAPGKTSLKGLGICLAAGLTLIMYSFMFGDNPYYKAAENFYVGVALGYGLIMNWRLGLKVEVMDAIFLDPPNTKVMLSVLGHRVVPIVLGLLLLTRLWSKYAWLSRYAYTPIVGWGAGFGIPVLVNTFILQQVRPAIAPLLTVDTYQALKPFTLYALASPAFWGIIGTLVILIGTVAVLFYFFFSVEHKGVGGGVSRIGIWFLMISFGASFGYTVMGRISLIIGRFQFLLFDWLGIPK
jgi:hypothetical protein